MDSCSVWWESKFSGTWFHWFCKLCSNLNSALTCTHDVWKSSQKHCTPFLHIKIGNIDIYAPNYSTLPEVSTCPSVPINISSWCNTGFWGIHPSHWSASSTPNQSSKKHATHNKMVNAIFSILTSSWNVHLTWSNFSKILKVYANLLQTAGWNRILEPLNLMGVRVVPP